MTQLFSPAKYVALDLHPQQLAIGRQKFARFGPRLVFQHGNAQQLPFASEKFDAAINVESSHSYPHFAVFLSEVRRVLKPGGMLCFGDLRKVGAGDPPAVLLRRQFEQAGFIVAHHEDITRNAWLSLTERREILGGLGAEFESLCALFARREFEYHWFVLTKGTPLSGDALS